MAKKLKPIPNFKSIQEEAEFWDTHSTTDYEWEEVEIEVAKPPKHTYLDIEAKPALSINLPKQVFTSMKKFSEKVQIPPQDLARIWISERVEMLSPTI